MAPTVRLFGTDREEIVDLESWFEHAPPEKGLAQWKDGYSAKEQARAWLRSGRPAVPEEFWAPVSGVAAGADELYARPEHRTRLDRYGRARQHDLFVCARREGTTSVVIGIEAKATEGFDGTVGDRSRVPEPSKRRARCNLLASALFGRNVMDEKTGALLDDDLSRHGYQLWTAAVGTIIEAQARDVPTAVVVIHQFRPRDLAAAARAGDARDWIAALEANQRYLSVFADALVASGSRSHETKFVRPGTRIEVMTVETLIDIPPKAD